MITFVTWFLLVGIPLLGAWACYQIGYSRGWSHHRESFGIAPPPPEKPPRPPRPPFPSVKDFTHRTSKTTYTVNDQPATREEYEAATKRMRDMSKSILRDFFGEDDS